MKWFGALLIATAGLGLGLLWAHRLYRRVEWLGGVIALLEVLEDRLSFSAAPLPLLWNALLLNKHTAALPLVHQVAVGVEQGLSFETALLQAIEEAAAQGWLLVSEREVLVLLASSLGRSGLTQQLQHIRRCRVSVEQARQAAATIATVRAPLYRTVGIAGGVCVALFLL